MRKLRALFQDLRRTSRVWLGAGIALSVVLAGTATVAVVRQEGPAPTSPGSGSAPERVTPPLGRDPDARAPFAGAAVGPSSLENILQRPFVPKQLLVGFEPGASADERQGARSAIGAEVARRVAPGTELLRLPPSATVVDAQRTLENRPAVLYAEPNHIYTMSSTTPNDPRFAELWGLDNTGQSINGSAGMAGADINAPEAWDTTTGSDTITVAVADTGVAYDHPDLAPNVWANPGEGGTKASNGLDDDGNGYVDDWRGWDWVQDDNDPRDLNGHGSHVAGTIAANGNDGTGVTGVSW
ncbi:MAG: S8 family serine peptidase, partial [Actinomycetota bacterium]